MSERIEIQPAALAQVHRALHSGSRVLVGADVQNIAQDLHEIRASLRLEYDPGEDIWIVVDMVVERDGSIAEKLVTTWDVEKNGPVDQRLVQRVREIASPGYDLAAELEKADRQAERNRAHAFRQQVGAAAERLSHALRKDLGMKGGRAFVPGDKRG